MKVAKWGNSLAVRLPADVVSVLGLKEGDEIKIMATQHDTFVVDVLEAPEVMLERIRRFRARLPRDFSFDRDEANRRG